MCSHFFSINCSTKDNEKLCKHFAEIALSFSCVLLSSLFFTPSSFRVFEFARVCVCVCAWFECCSFVADSWNDTNCYHCAPLSLWKLTTTTEKIHNSWGANTRFPVFSEGHLKGRWNDSHEWWIQNCSPPSQKKPPVLINAGDVCWAEHMRCFCLFIIPTGNALIGLNSSTYSRERPEDAKSTAANFAFKHERREEIRGNQQFTFALTIQC